MNADIYYVLNKYLDDIMPALASLPYSSTLDLADGLNVMDLRDYDFPLQCLVMRSVTDRIREHEEGTVNIIPEAWKFAPKQRGTPVRLAAEEYIREAAAMKNFLWIDSQDLAGVADVLMRQVGVWLFGVQRAKHEIERALDHMPEGLPVRRPRPADIATLSKGQFYVCFGREMHKVYVQPAWMTAAHAEAIARGEEEVDSARDILREYADEHKKKSTPQRDRESQAISGRASAGTVARMGERDGQDQSEPRSTGIAGGDREEAMWKEKYEALKAHHDTLTEQFNLLTVRLRQAGITGLGVVPGVVEAPKNGHPAVSQPLELDAIYAFVKAKAMQDGEMIHLLRMTPAIQVNVKAPHARNVR